MSTLKKTALILTIISLTCKIFGFGREIMLAYFFGTSYVVDSYLMAISIPEILFGWLIAISVAFTPVYTDIRLNDSQENSNAFLSHILTITFFISLAAVFVGLFFDDEIVKLTASGFVGEAFDLTIKYFNVAIWLVLMNTPIHILIAYLNCNNRYVMSALSALVISSTQLFIIVISGLHDKSILIYGYVVSYFVQLLLVALFSYKIGFRFRASIKFTSYLKKVFVIVIPIFLSSMIVQINTFVDKSFASKLVEGTVSALNYGAILKGFILSIFVMISGTMVYPILSEAASANDYKKLKDIMSNVVNIVVLIFVPVTVGSIVLGEPIVSFVYQRGEFDIVSLNMTKDVFMMYILGLLAASLVDVFSKVFYSLKDTKSTLVISIFTVILNIFLNILFIKKLKHSGIALATSLSIIVSVPLYFGMLRKKIGALGFKNTFILFIKSCISSLAMGIVVYFLNESLVEFLGNGKFELLISICVSVFLGMIVYFILMLLMKVKEMSFFTDMIKRVVNN